ncbi:hypothetical protein Peur_072898 [Populus x canadensis]
MNYLFSVYVAFKQFSQPVTNLDRLNHCEHWFRGVFDFLMGESKPVSYLGLEYLAVHRHSCATHAMVLVSVAVTPQLKDKEGKGEIYCYTGHSSRNKSNETASEKIGNAESSRPR